MRKVAWLLAFCFVAAPARAAEDAARAILDRALKAMGGKDLAKLAGVSFKTKGTFDAGGVQVEMSGEMSLQGLDRVRWEVEVSAMGRNETGSLVFNGGKGWASNGGQSREIPKEDAAVFLNVLRCVRLALNPTLLRQAGIKLAPLGELKIGDRETVGLKVTQKGFPDIDLFFDKKTGLPYKSEIRQKEGKQGMEMPHAFVFDSYKDFGGVKQFTKAKFLRDDKSLVEVECSDFKPQEKLDDSLFAQPAKN
jgi:outer membrane lipoprotein-sorting protein